MLVRKLFFGLLLLILVFPLTATNEEFNETEVIERLGKMDCDVIKPRYTVIVKGYLKNYLLWNRSKAERIIGRSVIYFPIFEEYIKKYNMPSDLKYLSVVESALDPVAISRVGALGLWQFMPETGIEVGLKINKYVDERQDPIKSTDAAMRYLRQQYRHFGSWELALAAYNGGSGRVSRAIKRGRSKNFWTIRKYLPTETANYVPAFIAACYVGHHFEEHGIKPTLPDLDYQLTETITIQDYITFIRLSNLTGLSVEEIAKLNPAYLKGFIPSNVSGSHLTLPKRVMRAVKAYLEEKNFDTETEIAQVNTEKFFVKVPSKEAFYEPTVYMVQPGETLEKLASALSLSHYHIRLWNNMDYDAVLKGETQLNLYGIGFPVMEVEEKVVLVAQVETLPPPPPIAPIKKPLVNMPPNTFIRGEYVYYTVGTKENLSEIAAKFTGVTEVDIKILNNFQSNQIPKAGKEIRIKKL